LKLALRRYYYLFVIVVLDSELPNKACWLAGVG